MVVSTRTQPGSLFVRTAAAMMLAKDGSNAAQLAANRWPDTPGVGLYLERAATGATSTADGVGGAMVVPGTSEFLNLVRPRTIAGRLDRLRQVPVHDGAAVATGGAVFGWVGEGAPTPVGQLLFSLASLPARKVGGIAVATEGLLRHSSPSAERAFRDELVNGAVEFMDTAFISADAEVADVSPAGLLDGVTATPSTGSPTDDLDALLEGFDTLDGVAVILSDRSLIALATQTPGAISDGMLAGVVPLVPSSTAGTNLIAVHQPSIMYADDGRTEIDSARHATIQMDTAPTNDAAEPTPAELVSMWQSNSVALKIARFVNWAVTTDDAVAVVSGADYGAV